MKNDEKTEAFNRRGFLRGIGIAAAVPVAVASGATAEAATPKDDAQSSSGYQETDHVRRVYATSRF